jgi:hypothetical protein
MLLGNAIRFLAFRGTARGLRAALALVLDPGAGPEIFGPAADEERGVRIVELYRTRVATSPLWSPADGAAALDRLWAEASGASTADTLPLRAPAGPPGEVWTDFARRTLGFVPESGPDVLVWWRDLLIRRYGSAAAARVAHGLAPEPDSLDDLTLPAVLPAREPLLTDWYLLQSAVVPARRTAHSFRVLLPVPLSSGPGTPATSAPERARRIALARRVVELEKPAHTTFDVRFYWDAFRVGEARLGLDTIADLGSRSPDLIVDAVLGASHLGASQLADASDRPAATGGTR